MARVHPSLRPCEVGRFWWLIRVYWPAVTDWGVSPGCRNMASLRPVLPLILANTQEREGEPLKAGTVMLPYFGDVLA